MTIAESLQVDTSKYERMSPPPLPASEPSKALIPDRDAIQICSMPVIPGSFPAFDNIRDFHLGGLIPQQRSPLPPPISAQGAGTTGNTIVNTSSSSSATSNPPIAQTASITTPVLNPGDQFTGTILLAKSFYLLQLTVSLGARVQLYSTAVYQTLDLSRNIATPVGYGTNQGIIFDAALDTAPTVWQCVNTEGSNADTPQTNAIYITITNIDVVSSPITATFTYVPTQS